ncbi:MAG: hypothetical protein M1837_004979 [Sclerophora amabilis]|nr:MAG: hypothetical protein M1837_004979 [Sclerophora amabilis]
MGLASANLHALDGLVRQEALFADEVLAGLVLVLEPGAEFVVAPASTEKSVVGLDTDEVEAVVSESGFDDDEALPKEDGVADAANGVPPRNNDANEVPVVTAWFGKPVSRMDESISAALGLLELQKSYMTSIALSA